MTHNLNTELLRYSRHLEHANKEVDKCLPGEKIVNEDIVVSYKFNSYGFRTHSLDDIQQPCWLVLGGSDTIGMANPEDVRWSNLLEQQYNTTVYNLGISGGSADTVTRLAVGWLDYIKPEKVFVQWPPPWRFELVEDNNGTKRIKHVTWREGIQFATQYFLEDQNSWINYNKNKTMIRGLCAERGIDYYETGMLSEDLKQTPKGRDDKHGGAEYHKLIADYFIKKL